MSNWPTPDPTGGNRQASRSLGDRLPPDLVFMRAGAGQFIGRLRPHQGIPKFRRSSQSGSPCWTIIQLGHSIYKLFSANKDGANYLVEVFDRYVRAINAFIKRGFEVSTIIFVRNGRAVFV
jgi:hypothetical protein